MSNTVQGGPYKTGAAESNKKPIQETLKTPLFRCCLIPLSGPPCVVCPHGQTLLTTWKVDPLQCAALSVLAPYSQPAGNSQDMPPYGG